MKKNGTIAARLVSVDAISAEVISALASCAALSELRVMAWCRAIFSSMTMELSTSMPTASTSPPSENTFSVMPKSPIRMKALRILTGMVTAMISVRFTSCRKNQTMSMARIPPITAELPTFSIDLVI
ncbi:MAG: hypothetical protein BWY76_03439 [bacterium ADurb.Bin429]|nr:MAG: hypothetical protein BWY76_03439 [bacterium ADurb.Bin429]